MFVFVTLGRTTNLEEQEVSQNSEALFGGTVVGSSQASCISPNSLCLRGQRLVSLRKVLRASVAFPPFPSPHPRPQFRLSWVSFSLARSTQARIHQPKTTAHWFGPCRTCDFRFLNGSRRSSAVCDWNLKLRTWLWVKIKPPGDRRLLSMFPFT